MRLREYPPAALPVQDDAHNNSAPSGNLSAGPGAAADDQELVALSALGFSRPLLAMLTDRARRNGTSIESELLHSGQVDEAAYYGAMARYLRLPFIAAIDPGSVADIPGLDTQLQRPNQVRINHRHKAPQVAVVPEAIRLADLKAALLAMPLLGQDLAITTPSAIRGTVWRSGATRRVREAINGLFDRFPEFSARMVLSGTQGFYAGLGSAALAFALIAMPTETLLLLHVLLSLIYFVSLGLRFAAFTRQQFADATPVALLPREDALPCYTVMVALYREAAVAEQLLVSLGRLDWPPSLLDIKLICEADDQETIAALRALKPASHFEIVEVPAAMPRTKPKALTYALGAARGEFLAIYDAEDRPHPQQLREAHARFRTSPMAIACLQAPLIITNARESWISALFSLEYCGLFRGLLPMLARRKMPLPLGGTSNHFRADALRAAGGWDPFNVTEDADLGFRLYRLGYRSDVMARQTLEDAPTTMRVWLGQRSRWFKGWLQTWLVLMRQPRRLIDEMGFPGFCIFQLMIGGMLVSSLLHPLIVVFMTLGTYYMLEAPADGIPVGVLSLFIIDTINILGSYLIFLGLGRGPMIEHERRLVGWRWIGVPLYWIMTSVAAWRAMTELRSKPFFWNKTPHQPSGRRT
ncbi:cellulose synthase/poly-beta-1,6-N-acetylglucosamine synthase-like glycosyltransferase [Neorhizobium galegae]|uniref:glycosyltransferase family 2 protein n=1 Tax=Neorhizobium galegae TaxID=399 RepID=UPI001AEA2DD5|nr:glycosyltransferase family 2 protein [Neorhizobium galegae]MBP2562031.1 cellulose synthase/poly-beta-1,6-N-acetylglucosamine synthase-like glycosyltransferase [Neorhizobium galegae]